MLQRALIGSLRYFASRRTPGDLEPSGVHQILVVELSRLGDVISMLPSLVALQRFFPNAHIRVLIDQRFASLLNSFDNGFEFIAVRDPSSIPGTMRALNVVRNNPFDLVISMSTPRRNALVALASNAHRTVGYLSYVDSLTPFLLSTPVEAFGFSLVQQVSYSKENIYERSAKICSALGIEQKNAGWKLNLKQEIYRAHLSRMQQSGVIPDNKYVLMFPFSGWEFRSWSLDRFISLARRIIDELGYEVVISSEYTNLKAMTAAVGPGSRIKVAVCSDLAEVGVVTRAASLVIGNDSGPLHLAAALGVKTVGLFGPASPELTSPQFNRGVSLYKKVECSPCDQRKCIRPDHPCIDLHEVDEVFSAVADALIFPAVGEAVNA